MKIKINFPGLNFEEIKFAFSQGNFDPSNSVAMLLLCLLIIWRSQIAISQTDQSIAKKDLQATPSMKLIAKIIGNNPNIHSFCSNIAVQKTAYFGLKDVKPKNEEERNNLIDMLVYNARKPGKAKMLTPRQITNSEELETHQRGIILSIKGNITSETLFKPSKIMSGINVQIVDWNIFYDLFIVLLKDLGCSTEHFFKNLLTYLEIEHSGELTKKDHLDIMERLFIDAIYAYTNKLEFEDGIQVSNNATNTVAIESCLDIKRNKPNILEERDFGEDDPFSKAAKQQMEELRRSDKALFGNKGRNKKSKNSKFW